VTTPAAPVAVGNGKAGAELLEATGERTHAPVVPAKTPPAKTTPPPPATTPAPTATASAPTATAPVKPAVKTPAPVAPAVAAAKAASHGSSLSDLPRDGLVVLGGLLLMGLAVAFRAIRARERRIGFALLGFCVIYLLALAGLVIGVA
jgi:hypothetical protein